jgi:hypothetical protein
MKVFNSSISISPFSFPYGDPLLLAGKNRGILAVSGRLGSREEAALAKDVADQDRLRGATGGGGVAYRRRVELRWSRGWGGAAG